MTLHLGLKDYATAKQKTYIDAVNETGSYRAAAKFLGVLHHDSVRRSIKSLKAKAALHGFSPEHGMMKTVPDSYAIKRRSQNFIGGELAQEWVISSPDALARIQALRDSFETMAMELPRQPARPAPLGTMPKLMNLYTFTDYHLGMMAWAPESGTDWDLPKAELLLTRAFDYMIDAAPPARVALINQLGDLLHSDGLLPITPTSGNVLDQGARYAEIVQVAIRVLRRLVDRALERHERVVVLLAEGNHDLASSIWLRAMFAALYENDPRVEVIRNEQPFYAYQHGSTMLGFHHGHKVKNEQLPGIFATRYRHMWGACPKVYIHTGHRHHVDEKEFSGAKVIQHPTLAAADAHSTRHGYDSQRETSVITYHEDHGAMGRQFVTPEMLEAA